MLLGESLRLVQVCVSLSDDATRRCEFKALESGMRAFGRHGAWAVTMDERGEFELEVGTVHVVPAWQWLLE